MAAATAVAPAARPAPVTWAQRKDKVYVVVELLRTREVEVGIGERSLHFSAVGCTAASEEEHTYTCDLSPLCGALDTEASWYVANERSVTIIGVKKEPGPHWAGLVDRSPRRTKGWLSVNWQMYLDEDDEEKLGKSLAEVNLSGVRRRPTRRDPEAEARERRAEAERAAGQREAEAELWVEADAMEPPGADADISAQLLWAWRRLRTGELSAEQFAVAKRKLLEGNDAAPLPD
eukprot:TRINITY_DN11903_c0_g1_i1.p1 TRINITY_DN11903_c0_g1~~TRINITY_DN11903_c0_g1_i1.p1  ORF type:complete len:233 (+),score=78.63 TRINITY_DN11903_c0_g1_i1:137-835(+)